MASVLLKNGLWRNTGEFPRIPCLSSSRSRRFLFTEGRFGNLGFACAYGNNGEWDPSLDIAVPEDQRPANELAALKERALYSWAELKPNEFFIRLGGLWALFFVFPGAPIAAASFDPSREPFKFFLAGESGALFAVAILILRMYLGWSYVGDRLLSAVVAYEETGWYDGQLWVKPPETGSRS